ncbi:hypothetical protein, partial [Klebsiella pneumoniae]|uniref:hypothetical protein n=1 Tax=Klebsiella pneumoniae TaxID=573 RepID=UPI001953CA5C
TRGSSIALVMGSGTLRSIYSTFLSYAKDLYLFAFLVLFKNCRNIMNFKILKGTLSVSSELE